MSSILLIGATGTVGRQVASQLTARGEPVRALVLRGDLTVPETLNRGLEGVDRVFLVWTAPPVRARPALERIAKHAKRIVFLSAPLKTAHPFFQQPNASRTQLTEIEQLIQDSGLGWTFLRPGMFAANALSWWAPQIRAGDVVQWPYLAAPTAPIESVT